MDKVSVVRTVLPAPISKRSYVYMARNDSKFIQIVKKLFAKWAYFIASHTTVAIVISILATCICGAKIAVTPIENDPSEHIPYGARVLREIAISEEYLEGNGKSIQLIVTLLDKDNGTVLNSNALREAVEIDDLISNNFTLKNHLSGRDETYKEFCGPFCHVNEPVRVFEQLFSYQNSLLNSNQSINELVNLSYPVASIYGQEINIQMNFHGIILATEHSREVDSNFSKITNMKYVKIITLFYRGDGRTMSKAAEARAFELDIIQFLEQIYTPKYVKIGAISYYYLDAEATRGGLMVLPYLGAGFAVMVLCSVISISMGAVYMQQFSQHKVLLAVVACICPLMANVTAIGALLMLGFRYGAILFITSFLVLAIGVDDAYLMIHTWNQITRKARRDPSKDNTTTEKLAKVMAETGPAILVSALTNILADVVGACTGSPEITLLCLGNMASIFVDFIYQITFYAALMHIAGQAETGSEQETIKDDSIAQKSLQQLSENGSDTMKSRFDLLLKSYIKFLSNRIFALLTAVIWAAFILFSIIGILGIRIEIQLENLFPADSPLIEISEYVQNSIKPQFSNVQIFINAPGNLSDPKRLNKLENLVDEFENLTGSWGKAWGKLSTNYFLQDYLEFLSILNATSEHRMTVYDGGKFEEFLEVSEYQKWKIFIKLDNTSALRNFFFTTAYHGEALRNSSEKSHFLRDLRSLADKYEGEFNSSIFIDDAKLVDLMDNMFTDCWQSALGIVFSMAMISFIFLYDVFTVTVVSVTIVSILTGMVGIVSWLNTTLEPVMVAALIISMGFSVDIPAHVAYHYNSALSQSTRLLTVQQRLHICFNAVALPALQTTINTSFCILAMGLIPIYMAKIFAQMLVSCLLLSVIHGLAIIPSIFILIDYMQQFLPCKLKNAMAITQ